MHIQVQCALESHNDIWQKKLFLFFKNNFKRNNHYKFIHHKSYLKPFLSYLPCIVRREYFSIIFNVKKSTPYSIKYGTSTFADISAKMIAKCLQQQHRLNLSWLSQNFNQSPANALQAVLWQMFQMSIQHKCQLSLKFWSLVFTPRKKKI